jgi:hypothetical protein
METQMKTLIAALALGTLVAAPAFVQSASALDPARERAIRECSRQAEKYKEMSWGVQEVTIYRACMGEKGQAGSE